MSLYNKKTLAVALALAMAAPSAYAYRVTTGNGTDEAPYDTKAEVIATQVGSTVTMSENVRIEVELGDIIVGRTTGFQVLVTLQDGAKFAPAGEATTIGVPAEGAGLVGEWNISLAAGGTAGSTQAQFTFEPGATNSRVGTGPIAVFNGLRLSGVATADGAVTRARFLVRDPVSTATLHDYTPNLIVRDNGLELTCTPEEQPYRIDVGGNDSYDPKTGFVSFPYGIGDAAFDTAALGTFDIEPSAQFQLLGTDLLTSTITGDFAAVENIFLGDAECAAFADNAGDYTINAAGTRATLEVELGDINVTSEGGSPTLCVTVDGETEIAAQSFNIQNSLTVGEEEIEIAGGACAVAPLAYNGSVIDVYHVNPAGNSTAQSFVRVINPSSLGGGVTVMGWDDNGVQAGPISFNLPAGSSKQFNSVDLENGAPGKGITGSFGDGTGKWRLQVTGEFEGMVVQGLNRNQDDGTVTNLTDADTQGEQRLQRWGDEFDGF